MPSSVLTPELGEHVVWQGKIWTVWGAGNLLNGPEVALVPPYGSYCSDKVTVPLSEIDEAPAGYLHILHGYGDFPLW